MDRIIQGGGPGPKLTTTQYNPDRGDVVVDALYGLLPTSMVVFSVPGHVVGTYNFNAYTDSVLSAYFVDPATGKPVLPVHDGEQVGVQVISKGGSPKLNFTYHKPSQPA